MKLAQNLLHTYIIPICDTYARLGKVGGGAPRPGGGSSMGGGGPPMGGGLGGLFANGMPKLRPAGQRGNSLTSK